MYVFATTFSTFDVAFFVFRKSKDYFKWLLAIFAVELIARHGDLRKNARATGLLIYGVRSRIAGVKAKQLSGRRSVSATALTLSPLFDLFDKFGNIKWRVSIHDASLHSAHGNFGSNIKHRIVGHAIVDPRRENSHFLENP
jgi:hypothetical protein